MKTLQYLCYGAVATLLMAADCSNKDSEFYNDVFVNSQNQVSIEPSPSFDLGTEFHINTDNFSRFVVEQSQPNPLDVYKTSGGANTFMFSFLIEKQNANEEWDLVTTPTVNAETGNVEVGDFVLAHAVYNATTQQYDFSAAIQLNEAGNFRLRFGYDASPSRTIILRSDSTGNNLFVNLNSYCEDLQPDGYYYYTVNE